MTIRASQRKNNRLGKKRMETFDHKAFYRSIPEIERLTHQAFSQLEDLHTMLEKARDSSRS